MEEAGAISPYQAGFRKGRSTTDQCLRMSQHINDHFQMKPPQRSLLMLFDYSRAFDTVWRTGLLYKMKMKGVPDSYIKWIRGWLVNRQARVRMGEEMSRPRKFKEGLPQGAVLSPMLFLMFIDDLLWSFEGSTLVSAYADDLALAVSAANKNIAEELMQREIEKVEDWSKRWRLNLNVEKCECNLFTTDTSEHNWAPGLTLQQQRVRHNPHPEFLGVTYDKQLTFGKHTEKVTPKMKQRQNLLKAIGGASWGWDRSSMRGVYVATQRSVAEYASPAWAPWLSATNQTKLERAQLGAARVITGVTRSTPTEAVLLEAGLERLEDRHRNVATITWDRWRNKEEGDPRREVARRNLQPRTRKLGWRTKCERWAESLEELRDAEEDGDRAVQVARPPWEGGVPCEISYTDTRKSDSLERQRERAEACIGEGGVPDVTIFTDGSAEEGVRRGGAGVVVYEGEERTESWSAPAGRICSSFSAELTAMSEAVRWLREKQGWQTATIVTDSRSLLDALDGSNARSSRVRELQAAMWHVVREQRKRVRLVWTPGHCGVGGNEEADRMAEEGRGREQVGTTVDDSTREACIRRSLLGAPPLQHERVRTVYGDGGVREGREERLTRAERVDLSRFRSGHHPKLRRWQHMVGKSESDLCRLCGEEEESTEHLWMRCPALIMQRFSTGLGGGLAELTARPTEAYALIRIILRRLE